MSAGDEAPSGAEDVAQCPACGIAIWELNVLPPAGATLLSPSVRRHLGRAHGWPSDRISAWAGEALRRHAGASAGEREGKDAER